MVKYLIWLLPYFLVLPGIGQNSKYRNAERFLGSNLQSVVKSIRVTPFMINQGNKFWYKYETSDGVRFYYVDPKAKKHQELFDRERVGRVLTELGHLPVGYKQISTSFSFLADHETIVFSCRYVLFELSYLFRRYCCSGTKKNSGFTRKN